MAGSPSSPPRDRSSSRAVTSGHSPLEQLVARLVQDMIDRGQRGESPRVEEYLDRYPELYDQPQAAVQLIHEEICLRQEGVQGGLSTELADRFPQWRSQVEVLLDCHRLLQAEQAAPGFPAVGENWANCRLVAELGRGAQGRVFLAIQPALADRPVVLKITRCDGSEHLSLARLQHTHIVPLYSVEDAPSRNLRTLCMPYFGGVTLDRVVDDLASKPVGQRTGKDVLGILDRARADAAVSLPVQGLARQVLARASYIQVICGIGACLADALQYAHERGLVHLDLKPSNILLAADGQPMLLDFHLAREPLRPDGTEPEWFGGTLEYMSPEQRRAMEAMSDGRRAPAAVDGRSDIYSLGLVLYESLGGLVLPQAETLPPLRGPGSPVSVGLSDIIARCLAEDPAARYASAGDLAADLRRQLSNKPLVGVANRSLAERWFKWRRRQPHALTLATLGLLAAALAAGLGVFALRNVGQRRQEALDSLDEGRRRWKNHDYGEALRVLTQGRAQAESFPADRELAQKLDAEVQVARRAQAAHSLHVLVDRLRFQCDNETLAFPILRSLEAQCRAMWDARNLLADPDPIGGKPSMAEQLRTDLLDLVLLWADLRLRLAAPSELDAARREVLQRLAEADRSLGSSAVLCDEQQTLADTLGLPEVARAARQRAGQLPPRSAWEHYARGRSWMRSGKLSEASAAFACALALQPQGFWPNFYQAVCAYRLGQHAEAVSAFRVCIALAPESAECYYNRGRAYAALGDSRRALEDYDRALALHPAFGTALLNRGILHFQEKRPDEALRDVIAAGNNGADPAVVHYHLAAIYLTRHDRVTALDHLRQALRERPSYPEARELLDRVQRQR